MNLIFKKAISPILVFLLLANISPALAKSYTVFVGDIQKLSVGKIKRVVVGNGSLLSTSILEDGNLLVLAESKGDTKLQVWLEDNSVLTYRFYITEKNSNRTSFEASQALANIKGISTRRVGENILIEGFVTDISKEKVNAVASKYKDIIDLTVKVNLSDIASLIKNIPGLNVDLNMIGKFAVLTGSVDSKGKTVIETIQGIFTELVDLTVENKVSIEPMVYMKVQITEFNTNAIENLGINWSTSIAGPSVGYIKDFSQHGDPTVGAFFNQTADTSVSGSGIVGTGAAGYFGIAGLITSTINVAVSNGDAILLASPTLSAKSGGIAKFLSGGQIPVPVPGPDGTVTIEYKDYGIKLDVEPIAGIDGNVTAKISTEVSSIDQSVSFGNIPGLKNRSAETEVNLKAGETLVISGLVNREIANDASKVKWLGEIPVLGELFQSNNFRNNRSDLVIFITPEIIYPGSKDNVEQIDRAKKLRQQFIQNIDEGAEILD